MTILRRLFTSLRRTRSSSGMGVSRRDALMVSLGSAIPIAPGIAAERAATGAPTQAGPLVARPGAPIRTIQAKSLDVYSVNDKGATGDGKTDDTAAINAAILEVHSAGGGEIIFGASRSHYYVKGPVIVPSNVTLDLNGQTLSGDGFNSGCIMFATGMVRDGHLVPNKGSLDERDFVFYSAIRNGMIRKCSIAFDFQNFNISCSIDNISTFEALQFGRFDRCFYMSMSNCSARGPSDPARPAFSFIGANNLISLWRVSATMGSGFLFDGGTTSVSMIACSNEGGSGSAVTFRGDCFGILIDACYWEAIRGTVFDFTAAKLCSVSFKSNYFNICDTVLNDGGETSGATLFGHFDETNYIVNIGATSGGFHYRGRMIVNCPRNFIRFDIPFSNDDDGTLPPNWIVGASTRIVKETASTGPSPTDVRNKSRIYYEGPIPLVREGDVGAPLPGAVVRCRTAIARGSAAAATIDTGIVWRPNSLRATFILSVVDDGGVHKLFGDVYGDQVVQQDRGGHRVLAEDHEGHVRLRLEGVDNQSGIAAITGTVQLCT